MPPISVPHAGAPQIRLVSLEAAVNVAPVGRPDNRYRVTFRYGDGIGAIDIPIFVEASAADVDVVKKTRSYLASFAATLAEATKPWADQGAP